MNTTKIEWAEKSVNILTGCTPISTGCRRCYAAGFGRRLKAEYLKRAPIVDTPQNRANPFALRYWPEKFAEIAARKKPARIFMDSMSDWFHQDVPGDILRNLFTFMVRVSRHTYMILTKRPDRMYGYVLANRGLFPDGVVPGHIWLGTTVEHQSVIGRVDVLREIPAKVQFVSCEPLLGPLELDMRGLSWIIVGGERALGARPMDINWARSLRDQAVREGIPFFFKKHSGCGEKEGQDQLDGCQWHQFPTVNGRVI